MELRKKHLKKEDLTACAKEMMLAFHIEPWNENWTFEQAYTRIEEIMSSDVSRGYVIYDGDLVVSMMCGRIMTYLDHKELWIDDLSVHPDYQGLGIGTQLLDYVKQEMKEEGVLYLLLNTTRGFGCVDFYKKNGFEELTHIITLASDV